MAEIKVLDSSIFNRIAAGEVVESPAAVVKELVENSIDASAQNIVIEISGGGIDLIRVIDDGKGVSEADMPTAFLPHATSKIKTIDDLNRIGTLGFRGEALPSIASVASIKMTSRQADSDLGYFVFYEDGRLVSQGQIGASFGTVVEVEGLFKNIPARKKFLKKPSSEAAAITSLVQKIILANPDINIKYINENNVVFHSAKKGIEYALYSVYGENMLQGMDKIENNSSMSDITLFGYVSKPTFSKHNRSFQTLIVNGRVVECDELSFRIHLCYQDYLMKRQYPAYVLYLNLPADMVDVNVHPNKLKVKFVEIERIKNIVAGAVKKSINKEMLIPSELSLTTLNVDNTDTMDGLASTSDNYFTTNNAASQLTSDMLFATRSDEGSHASGNKSFQQKVASAADMRLREQATSFNFMNAKAANISLDSKLASDRIIAGKLFNTYLLIQFENDVYLIDQHAAHERILYDKFIKCINDNSLATQDLLIPYVFYVDAAEKEMVDSILPTINSIGFTISEFGENSYSISSVPAICSRINLQGFVPLLLQSANENTSIEASHFYKDKIAQMACKAAVKGADDLSKTEIDLLLDEMEKNGGALLCPHGRPTVIKLSKTEIEKWFKRVR